jgi:hypothetical protein
MVRTLVGLYKIMLKPPKNADVAKEARKTKEPNGQAVKELQAELREGGLRRLVSGAWAGRGGLNSSPVLLFARPG